MRIRSALLSFKLCDSHNAYSSLRCLQVIVVKWGWVDVGLYVRSTET